MKKLKNIFLILIVLFVPILFFTGCFDGGETPNVPKVTYGTVKVNYHYQYDVVIENYQQAKYKVAVGEEYELSNTDFYKPSEKIGYIFKGWTLMEGGEGEVITKLIITSSKNSETIYNLYAKFEAIQYNVIYHLNGGKNNLNNVTTLTGSATLYNPTKENAEFQGWYYDAEFKNYASKIKLQNNSQTEIHLYAKWRHTYKFIYKSNMGNLPVKGDVHHREYKEGFLSEIVIYLYDGDYFENYRFLGWTYNGQTEPVLSTQVTIEPGTIGDIEFVANFVEASNFGEYDLNNKTITYDVTENNVNEIIVPDVLKRTNVIGGVSYTGVSKVIVKYTGEIKPTVLSRCDNVEYVKVD